MSTKEFLSGAAFRDRQESAGGVADLPGMVMAVASGRTDDFILGWRLKHKKYLGPDRLTSHENSGKVCGNCGEYWSQHDLRGSWCPLPATGKRYRPLHPRKDAVEEQQNQRSRVEADLILEYRRLQQAQKRILPQMLEIRWQKLVDHGFPAIATRACMFQENIPVSQARAQVRRYGKL